MDHMLSEILCNLTSSCCIAHREHSSHCCVFAGTCLLSCCLETDCITPFFCCRMLHLVYGADAWQGVDQIRYITFISRNKKWSL
jgi:hypothetical protein